MQITKIQKLILDNELNNIDNLLHFLDENWNNLSEKELRSIAEYANAKRQENSAYYTDDFIVDDVVSSLPIVRNKDIKVLEPSVGIGNFVSPIVNRLSKIYNTVNVVLNDLDPDSLKIANFFITKEDLPSNVTISFSNEDFLSDLSFYNYKFDYVIGNPPFQRLTNKQAAEYGAENVTNLSGQFMLKAISISKVVALIMPKNLLSTTDYSIVRSHLLKKHVNTIIDFGEKGFKGVLIETLAVIAGFPNFGKSQIKSYVDNSNKIMPEKYFADSRFPTWLIYRNSKFDQIANHMEFNIFNTFRDRQLTNANMKLSGAIRVIKSRNILRDGTGIIDVNGYDRFIDHDLLSKINVGKYYSRNDVYLVPNMTYYPRMIKKSGNYVVNGSVAVLELKKGLKISDKQVKFLSSDTFHQFYKIARNKGTRSLNIDNTSVFWFGKYTG